MDCQSIAAINDEIVTIDTAYVRSDNSTSISFQFYRIDAADDGLSRTESPITRNIAAGRVGVYCCAEAVDSESDLYRYFVLCGPCQWDVSASELPFLWLYAVDDRDITLFNQCRLPATTQTCLPDVKFYILDGPTVCFVQQSEIYVVTREGSVQTYPTVADGVFRNLTMWCEGCCVVAVGLRATKDTSATEQTIFSLCINTSEQLFGFCCDALVPVVYTDILTCLYLSDISVDWNRVAVLDHTSEKCEPVSRCFSNSVVYLCTSYSQLVECRSGQLVSAVDLPFNDGNCIVESGSSTRSSVLMVQSCSNAVAVVDMHMHQVLRQLEDVHTVLYGDFLHRGSHQALFLPRASRNAIGNSVAVDILSVVDAGIETSQSDDVVGFGSRFLLTDFSQVTVDRWNQVATESMSAADTTDVLETMIEAVGALQCRAAAGRAELTSAALQSYVKQSVIDSAVAHLMPVNATDDFTTPLVEIASGSGCSSVSSAAEVGQLDDCVANIESVELSSLWQTVSQHGWIVGLHVHNNSSRRLRELSLLLLTTDSDHCSQPVTGTSRCFTYWKRLPPSHSDVVGPTRKRPRRSVDSGPVHREGPGPVHMEGPLVEASSAVMEHYRGLIWRHKVKVVDSLWPRQEGHILTVVDVSRDRRLCVVGDRRCSVVVTWFDSESQSSTAVHRSYGDVTLAADDVVNSQLNLASTPSHISEPVRHAMSPVSPDQQQHRVLYERRFILPSQPTIFIFTCTLSAEDEQIAVCLRALSPCRRTMLLKSTDKSPPATHLSTLLSPLSQVLSEKLRFSVCHGCCVCTDVSSPLYLCSVEAAAVPAGYHLHKLRLSAKDECQLLLLVRLLYGHLPRHLVLLPATDDHLARCLNSSTRSMYQESLLSCNQQKPSSADNWRPSSQCRRLPSDDLSSRQLQAETDSHVLNLLHCLYTK